MVGLKQMNLYYFSRPYNLEDWLSFKRNGCTSTAIPDGRLGDNIYDPTQRLGS